MHRNTLICALSSACQTACARVRKSGPPGSGQIGPEPLDPRSRMVRVPSPTSLQAGLERRHSHRFAPAQHQPGASGLRPHGGGQSRHPGAVPPRPVRVLGQRRSSRGDQRLGAGTPRCSLCRYFAQGASAQVPTEASLRAPPARGAGGISALWGGEDVKFRTTSRCRLSDGTASSVRQAAARSSPARRSAARHRLSRPQPRQTMRFHCAPRAGGHRPIGSGRSPALEIVYRRQVFRATSPERVDSEGAVEPRCLEVPPTSLLLMTACSSRQSRRQAAPTQMAPPCSCGRPARLGRGNIDRAARRQWRMSCARAAGRGPRRATPPRSAQPLAIRRSFRDSGGWCRAGDH